VERVQRYLLPHLATNSAPAQALISRLNDGERGMKDGRGFYEWTKKESAETVALRDKQIVRQLKFLREQGALSPRPC